jgi:hypothetical protein
MSSLFIASIASISVYWILVFIKRHIHIKYLMEVNEITFTSKIDKMFFLTPYLPEIYLYKASCCGREGKYFKRKRKIINFILALAYLFLLVSLISIVGLLFFRD